MIRFRDALTALGIQTTIRASRGEDIQAACGLLSTAFESTPFERIRRDYNLHSHISPDSEEGRYSAIASLAT